MAYEVKQVIVIRKDLKMRQGKSVAQGAHASLTAVFSMDPKSSVLKAWWSDGQAKICVYVESEEELLEIYRLADANNLPCSIITDSGHTEFHGIPTKTAVAIGPAKSTEIDKITGNLKLL